MIAGVEFLQIFPDGLLGAPKHSNMIYFEGEAVQRIRGQSFSNQLKRE
jgi:hypothetical protein